MKVLNTYSQIYFVGIGGIGMSALARYFKTSGLAVEGYDKTPSELTDELIGEGIKITFTDKESEIPGSIKEGNANTLVVYTPAIPKDSIIYNYFLNNGFDIAKRSEVLAAITEGKTTIAVAGTHGKTSTVALITHILKTANVPFTAFIGGIASNYKTNYVSASENPELMVVEADEFDRSFLRLNPDTAVITAVESDHLDIYGTEEELKKGYTLFTERIKPGGKLLLQESVSLAVSDSFDVYTYSVRNKAQYIAKNIRIENGQYIFDLDSDEVRLEGLKIGVPGRHNIENAVAAIAATYPYIKDEKVLYKALETFKGVHRRFELVYKDNNKVYVDDYAHHPTEIATTVDTLKELYPDKKILGIFQPHLYSRTRDLAHGFGQSLSKLDELILLPIYPARELPIEGVSSELILKYADIKDKQIVEKDGVVSAIKKSKADVIATIGAGDIDRLVKPIKDYLEAKK